MAPALPAGLRRRAVARGPTRRGGARPGAAPGPGAARLLFPRDVPAAAHDRSVGRRLVAGFARARVLDAGEPVAAGPRLGRRRRAHLRAGLRLPAGLVAGRAADRV